MTLPEFLDLAEAMAALRDPGAQRAPSAPDEAVKAALRRMDVLMPD
jgi:hypothetical protein